MNLLVGCPVLRREWIIREWINHTEISCSQAGADPSYVFVCDPRDPTRRIIELTLASLGREVEFVDVVDKVDDPHNHAWGNPGNLHKMVTLRNLLLEAVRRREPDLFLSLDSDILCHPEQVPNLVETLTKSFDAVGGKAYMAPGRDFPSWANYSLSLIHI